MIILYVISSLRLKIRNLDLWAKIIILVVFVFFCLFLTLSYLSWSILNQQQAQERRVKKLFAVEQSLQDDINRMGLAAKHLAASLEHDSEHQPLELNSSKEQRKLLKTLVDTQFVFLFDEKGQIISGEAEGLTLKEGYRFQVEKLAQAGGSVQGIEAYPAGTFLPEQTRPSMLITGASPIMEGGKVKAVLVIGKNLGQGSNFLVKASRQVQTLVALYYQDQEVFSAYIGEVAPPSMQNVLTKESYNNFLAKGQTFYGNYFIGESKYLSSANPIKDVEGHVVGALFVGQTKEPIMQLFQFFIQRFAFLSIIALAIVLILLSWIYKQINRPLTALVSGASNITKGNLAARIKSERVLSCWAVKKCQKTNCTAFGNMEIPCWYVGGKDCSSYLENQSGDDFQDDFLILNCCHDCEVYLCSRGNQLDQLADAFNFMAQTLEKKQSSLNDAFQELQAQNEELSAQREELVAQQEILVTQQDDLVCINQQLELAMEELDSSHNVIYTLVLALEARDHYTRGHSERVAMYAVKLARSIGLPEGKQEQIKRASILHDLGKIGVSDVILSKPGRLDHEEMRLVKQHPVIAERICQPLKTTANLLPIIRHHHEWVNGQGYPDGLQGEKIPLDARILAVADAFDAMTSIRPYRKTGLTRFQAVEILKDGSGVQWDADLVKAFIEIVEKEEKLEAVN